MPRRLDQTHQVLLCHAGVESQRLQHLVVGSQCRLANERQPVARAANDGPCKFLQVGLKPEGPAPRNPTAYWDQVARIPRTPHPFAYLNLFGTKRDEDSEMYSDCNSRQTVFQKRFFENVSARVDRLQKEGGVIGRAASAVDQAVKEGMREFEASGAVESQDLLELW